MFTTSSKHEFQICSDSHSDGKDELVGTAAVRAVSTFATMYKDKNKTLPQANVFWKYHELPVECQMSKYCISGSRWLEI